ncbi:pyridoxal phosphate phosphatase PHOSPHO2-like [Bactrocera neohumeralis]|uniref:pyridoxal phosphate phosphatase PHOSPHO2-like n=1 Tax=Bactrocera neohumeralis TaxID=98809 RepID=UPI00216571B9|nr:pyridoxal phosphate phosphatase PHOSPHO2-like [Bactrocera neohumeralis]
MPSRQLIIFDFDETIISVNSMRQLFQFIPNYRRPQKNDSQKKGWIDYTNKAFKELHSMGYPANTMCKFIRAVPPVPGMVKLIHYLWNSTEPTYDLILISDGYRILIADWLEQHGIFHCFTGIYCNPSKINDCGEVTVSGYHCAECPYSPQNLCKRRVMEEFISMQKALNIKYDRVAYIGNGSGDFCPALGLGSCDLVCARKYDTLAEKIQQNRKKLKIKPEIYLWVSGYELIAKLAQNKDTDNLKKLPKLTCYGVVNSS